MRYPASEKVEIIRLVGHSHLPARRTLERSASRGPRSTASSISPSAARSSACSTPRCRSRPSPQELGRHRSTIHREISRNHFHAQREYAGYYPLNAQDLAIERRRRRRKLCRNDVLRRYVIAGLERCWSPEQIAGRLKQEGADDGTVCHETIYRYVYGPEGREAGLYRHLPKARRRRQPRYGRKPRTSSIPANRVDPAPAARGRGSPDLRPCPCQA